MKDWFNKRKISLKGRINTTSMILSIFILMMMLVVGIKDSYSATVPFEGAMMGTFPRLITDQKEKIEEVNFIKDTEQNINTRYNKASIKADLTDNATIKVLGWLEPLSSDKSKYVLYVASVDKIYLSTGNSLFYEWKNLKTINFNNIDTSQVTKMRSMFAGCHVLTDLDISNFNTSKVTSMRSMFSECSSLTNLDVSNFDTSKVTDMRYMFYSCHGLINLDVSNFNTSQVTDMSSMFVGCKSLKILDISNFDVNKAKSLNSGLKLEDISVIISSPYILFNKLTNVGQIKDLFAGVVYSNNNVTKTDNDKFATNDYIIDTNSKKYYIYVLGDTNGDGELTLSDIMKTANYVYKNKNSLSGAYLKAADYNLDGSYNLQDIMKMANALYKGGK